MSEIKAKEITQEKLIRLLKDSHERNSSIHCGFILGSGASVKSRIPSGSELSKKWYDEIKEDTEKNEFNFWLKEKTIDEKNLAESYTKIFAKRFEADFRAGYEELQRYMDKAEPSIGYSFLAQFLSKTSHKFIITTNFDTMVEDALFGLKEAKPLVLGHELLSKYINPTSPTRPTIIKIHRDFLLDPYNTDDEIKELDAQWQESLKPLLKEHSMIVIGYGGNDDSLMNYLNNIEDRKPIYWCFRGNKSKLSSKITSILTEKDFIVEIQGFDKFMLLLNDKLNLGTIIDKEDINNSPIVKNALKYADKYKKQLEELTKDELNPEEQKAVEKLLPSWWHYELEVQKEKDNDKKEQLYKDGLNVYPNSHELMNNYAGLLQKIGKDKEASIYCKKALDIEPNDALYNGNYALLLEKQDQIEAEFYYKRSIDIESNNASLIGNYANLLQKLNKNNEAEAYYKKALEINPNNANCNGNYSQLLLIKGKKEEANFYIENAFKNHTTENDLLVELWFYRLAHYPEYFEKAKNELNLLLSKGFKSIGWNFSKNIEQAKKEEYQNIELLKDYAKRITTR